MASARASAHQTSTGSRHGSLQPSAGSKPAAQQPSTRSTRTCVLQKAETENRADIATEAQTQADAKAPTGAEVETENRNEASAEAKSQAQAEAEADGHTEGQDIVPAESSRAKVDEEKTDIGPQDNLNT